MRCPTNADPIPQRSQTIAWRTLFDDNFNQIGKQCAAVKREILISPSSARSMCVKIYAWICIAQDVAQRQTTRPGRPQKRSESTLTSFPRLRSVKGQFRPLSPFQTSRFAAICLPASWALQNVSTRKARERSRALFWLKLRSTTDLLPVQSRSIYMLPRHLRLLR